MEAARRAEAEEAARRAEAEEAARRAEAEEAQESGTSAGAEATIVAFSGKESPSLEGTTIHNATESGADGDVVKLSKLATRAGPTSDRH
jgi:hypothetical protein